jgi:hypothetical protein
VNGVLLVLMMCAGTRAWHNAQWCTGMTLSWCACARNSTLYCRVCSRSQTESILTVLKDVDHEPPTYFRTNKLTYGFQVSSV